MAKRDVYGEKSNPFLTFLYIVVALALVAALAMMYAKDRDRRRQFKAMVSEAASSEMSLDIASLKARQTTEGEAEPTSTAEPEAEIAASLPEVYLPEPEQVQESISEK